MCYSSRFTEFAAFCSESVLLNCSAQTDEVEALQSAENTPKQTAMPWQGKAMQQNLQFGSYDQTQ